MISLFIFISFVVLTLANMLFKAVVGKDNFLVESIHLINGLLMIALPFVVIFEIAK